MCSNLTKLPSVGITYGRFNLLHNGHIQLFRELSRCGEKAIIGISSNSKNLPLNLRLRGIRKVLGHEITGNYQILTGNNPFDVFDQIKDLGFKQITLVLGHDQATLSKNVTKHLGWKSRIIPRITSSTKIRRIVDQRDWTNLYKSVPNSAIIDVMNCRKLEIQRSQINEKRCKMG